MKKTFTKKILCLITFSLLTTEISGTEKKPPKNIILNDITTMDTVNTGGSVTAKNAKLPSINAGGSITLNNCQITHEINAGGSITASHCKLLGVISAGGLVNIDECPNVLSISSGNHISLHESTVQENVSAGHDVEIKNSTIKGILSCVSNYLVIENSQIDTIDLNYKQKDQPQILKLHNCKVRYISFRGEKGEVFLLDGSTLTGTITGGTLKK